MFYAPLAGAFSSWQHRHLIVKIVFENLKTPFVINKQVNGPEKEMELAKRLEENRMV